jgi:ABC-type branched-subunit amino acid transport system permease subunit
MGGYIVYILPQYMTFGVLAMSLALLWGFTGILSFGQAGFFAIGGYAVGLLMSMSLPVNGFYLGLLVAAASGAVIAGLIGYFLFSAGVRDAYFVLVTLALSIVVEQIAVSQSQWTGGWNGMFLMRPTLTFFGLSYELFDDTTVYYAVLIFVLLAYVALYRFTRSAAGKIVVGIRENEMRMVSLGVSATFYKTLVFAISGVVACLAGSIYGVHSGFVSPSLGGVLFSTEVVVWVAIAGRSSLIGALLGGIVVSSLSNFLSAITPAYWQLVLGFIFIVAIAYFRGGVAGAIERLFAKPSSGPA